MIAASISVIAIVLHLVDIPATSLAGRSLVDALHAPGFGLIAVSAVLLFRMTAGPRTAYVRALLLALALAVISEAAQYVGPRDADVADLLWDLLGICGFLAVAASVDEQCRRELSLAAFTLLLSLGIVASLWALQAVVSNGSVLIARATSMPVLATFDDSWELGIYRPLGEAELSTKIPPEEWPIRSGTIMAIDLALSRYSGIIIDPYPDWSEYQSISFVAASADGEVHEIWIRVHDAEHNSHWEDRYNKKLQIRPSVARYEIELSDLRSSIEYREFEVSRVANIVLYKVDSIGHERILIDDIRLNRKTTDGT